MRHRETISTTPSGRAKFGTTLWYMAVVPEFGARANVIEMPPDRPLQGDTVAEQVRTFWRVLKAAAREDILLLYSSRGSLYPELMATVAVSFWPRRLRPKVILYGCMWQPNSGWRRRLESLIVRLADRTIHRYAVVSSTDLTVFPENWGIDPSKVRFTPHFSSFSPDSIPTDQEEGRHVFAGGNPFRDYDSLVEAARRMPDREFILATHHLDGRTDLPANVRAGPVPHEEFVRLLQTAAAVVVPMRTDIRRAVGQQTYLNAMRLGRPVIVSDALGVRDYIRHGETGLIVEGRPESYVEALRWALDEANRDAVRTMCETAHRDAVERFSNHSHARHLLAVVDEVAGDTPRPQDRAAFA